MKALKKATTKRLIKELSKRGAVYGIMVDDEMTVHGPDCCLLTLLFNVAARLADEVPEGGDAHEILSKFVNEMVTAFGEPATANEERYDDLADNNEQEIR